jgi:DNA-binding transcriptional regulator LsrR (DeoR family)
MSLKRFNAEERQELMKTALDLKQTEGLSNRRIAGKLGVSPTTINRLLRPQELAKPNPVKTKNYRPWLHEVQTAGVAFIRRANSLWPPTKTPNEKE